MKQESGDNSQNIQAAGDMHVTGVTYAEARQIALDVFKSNFYDLSIEAKQKAEERVAEITDKVIEKIYSEIPDKANRINDPDIQYSIFNAQKEYARIGDAELCESLVDILIDKIQIEDRNSESFVIDDALQILPKLSKANLALLSMMVFSKLGIPVNGRNQFKGELVKLNPIIDNMNLITDLDMAYLKQSGCVFGTASIGVNGNFEKRLKEEYMYFYSTLNNGAILDELLLKYTQNDTAKQIKLTQLFDLDGQQILGLKYSNENRYKEFIQKYPAVFEDWVESFCKEYISKQEIVDDNKIKQFHIALNAKWSKVFELMSSQQVKSFNINPVGLYIGSMYLSKIIGKKITLNLFY